MVITEEVVKAAAKNYTPKNITIGSPPKTVSDARFRSQIELHRSLIWTRFSRLTMLISSIIKIFL